MAISGLRAARTKCVYVALMRIVCMAGVVCICGEDRMTEVGRLKTASVGKSEIDLYATKDYSPVPVVLIVRPSGMIDSVF